MTLSPPTNLIATLDAKGSLAASLGTPDFSDSFNYQSVNDAAFKAKWNPQSYIGKNYAGAGSDCTFAPSNISFPIDLVTGGPCLCEKLSQSSASASSGAELLSKETFGYGTFEFCSRMGSNSGTPSGVGVAISGGVSSTFLISNDSGGTTGYVEIDAPECEGQHATWAEVDVWYNGNGSGNNAQPSGPGFHSQGAGSDTYFIIPDMPAAYHYYGFVWAEGKLDFYLDGTLQGSLTGAKVPVPGSGGNIPCIDINHYGCNGVWGGKATVGVERFFYVRSAKYWKGK